MKALKRTSRAFDNVFLFSMPRAEAKYVLHRSRIDAFVAFKKVLQMWTNQGCHSKIC